MTRSQPARRRPTVVRTPRASATARAAVTGIPGNTVCPRCHVSSAGGTGCLCPAVTDSLGVDIEIGDWVRVLAWGAPVRLTDTGRLAQVEGFTSHDNVRLAVSPHDSDPIARGKAVSPGMLGVLDRSGDHDMQDGYEGNRDLYPGSSA